MCHKLVQVRHMPVHQVRCVEERNREAEKRERRGRMASRERDI
jgi:hypothetical protein